MLTLIFANGEFAAPEGLPALLARTRLIIAADGGASHCARLGLVPDILIGDLDSLAAGSVEQLRARGVAIHRHPPKKDATDLELALDLAVARGATEIWLACALGGRWDMSLANIMLCALDKYRHLAITLAGGDCRMHILRPGPPFTVHSLRPGGKVSLLPLTGDVHGLNLAGFRYPLKDASLAFGSSRGVSNVLIAEKGTVSLTEGILLCICLAGE